MQTIDRQSLNAVTKFHIAFPSPIPKHPYNQIIAILYLYNAENVIVAQMLSLTVDQKVI